MVAEGEEEVEEEDGEEEEEVTEEEVEGEWWCSEGESGVLRVDCCREERTVLVGGVFWGFLLFVRVYSVDPFTVIVDLFTVLFYVFFFLVLKFLRISV